MLPIPDKSYVTTEYVDNWQYIKNGKPYIVLTMDDGIVFKIAENKIEKERKLTLHSLNTVYDPFDISIKDVKEVWKFVNYISSEMPDRNVEKDDLVEEVRALRKEVMAIQMKLDL